MKKSPKMSGIIVNNNMTINILGTEYKIIECGKHEDDYLNRCDGYCDKTSKKIVVGVKEMTASWKILKHTVKRSCGMR